MKTNNSLAVCTDLITYAFPFSTDSDIFKVYNVYCGCFSFCKTECCMSWYFVVSLFEPPHDKTNKMSMRPAKTQISLGIRPVWSESSLCAQWVAKDPRFLHADSEDSDQTGRKPRLIWVFTKRTLILLILSCRGSFASYIKGFDLDILQAQVYLLCES